MTPIGIGALVALSSVLATLITGFVAYVTKKMETRTQVVVQQAGQGQNQTELAWNVLQAELDRRSAERAAQTARIDSQEKQISDLRLTSWLTLQHVLDVHRHFAEGNPPPPPPIPEELLEFMRDG